MGKIGDAVGITFVAAIGVSSIDAEVSRNSMRLKKAWQEPPYWPLYDGPLRL
jgi:hypothetical protein